MTPIKAAPQKSRASGTPSTRRKKLIQTLAGQIRTAGQEGKACSAISDRIAPDDLVAAYQIQAINVEHWRRKGRRIVGRKIGITSPDARRRLGIQEPICGVLFADMIFTSGDEIPANRFHLPKAEPEIALVLKRDLSLRNVTLIDVMQSCDFLVPAIEITDTRYSDAHTRVVDDIADNCSSGIIVLGTAPFSLKNLRVDKTEIFIERNGSRSSKGIGSASISTALAATVWLANKMMSERMPLRSGDVIMTGAIVEEVALKPGDKITAAFEGLVPVSTTLFAERLSTLNLPRAGKRVNRLNGPYPSTREAKLSFRPILRQLPVL
jgi:2-keto-4-pentenoate hydratase